MRQRQLHVLVLAVALVGSTAVAHAEKAIAIESHVGERAANADELLKPIFAVLTARDFEVGTQMVGSAFEARVSRPALTATGLPGDFAAQVDRGHKAWAGGHFEDAVQALQPLVDAAHANAGAFARDQGLRDALQKALIVLALSQQRMGDVDAMTATFGELVRAFPEATVSRAAYGSDAFTQFDTVKQELAAARHGKLTIATTNDEGTVFVDEKIQKVGTVTMDVVPGQYRVFAQFGKQLSRVHLVTVGPGDDVGIEIDSAFDAIVHTGPGWTGLAFSTPADREKLEAAYAADFAASLRSTGGVAVVGIDQSRGRPVVFAALVNPRNGREIRRASVALEPAPGEDRLRSLATFIVDNRATPGVDVEVGGAAGDGAGSGATAGAGGGGLGERHDDGAPHRRWGGWPVLTGVVAVGALGAGAFLLARDGDCSEKDPVGPCQKVYSNAAPGWAAVGGGAVFTAVTIYLIATRGHGDARAKTAYVLPTGDGAIAGLATRF